MAGLDHAPDCGRYYTDPDGAPNPKPCDCGADHDGQSINVGPVNADDRIAEGSCTDYRVVIDTDEIRDDWRAAYEGGVIGDLCDEVDRLRAQNAALAAALEDIAGMVERKDMAGNRIWIPEGECTDMGGGTCYQADPADPNEWCPVCVAEVAWCAWKIGEGA